MKALPKYGSHSVVAIEPGWQPILEAAALEVFQMMANARLTPNPSPDTEPGGGHTAMVGMAGALCGMTTVRCSQASSAKLASLMLGESVEPDQSTARDALGEICNMIAGNFKGKISQLADQCMLSVPTVITGEDYAMSAPDPSDGVTVCLMFEGEPIWISVIVHS